MGTMKKIVNKYKMRNELCLNNLFKMKWFTFFAIHLLSKSENR
jgi:hypothetical protein